MDESYDLVKHFTKEFLRKTQLEELNHIFEKNSITPNFLMNTTDDELNKLGINTFKQRSKIMMEIKNPDWIRFMQETREASLESHSDDAKIFKRKGNTSIDYTRPKSVGQIKQMHEKMGSPKPNSKEKRDSWSHSWRNENDEEIEDTQSSYNDRPKSMQDVKQMYKKDSSEKKSPILPRGSKISSSDPVVKIKKKGETSSTEYSRQISEEVIQGQDEGAKQNIQSSTGNDKHILYTREKPLTENDTAKHKHRQSVSTDVPDVSSDISTQEIIPIEQLHILPPEIPPMTSSLRKASLDSDPNLENQSYQQKPYADDSYSAVNSSIQRMPLVHDSDFVQGSFHRDIPSENLSDPDKKSEKHTKKVLDFSSSHQQNDREIRIILLGKTGSGKSATGNSILGMKAFPSKNSFNSVTKKCSTGRAKRFGMIMQVIDTPGVFDTHASNSEVNEELVKCIAISSPGPHVFILVLGSTRFTNEENDTVNHFVNYFGDEIYNFFIVLFTRKDDLDEEEITLEEHINNVPQALTALIQKCKGRCIAFNNRAKEFEQENQVKELLDMIERIIQENGDRYYTNELYRNVEGLMKIREMEMRKEMEEKNRREIEEMKRKSLDIIKAKDEQIEELEIQFNQQEKHFEELQTNIMEDLAEYRDRVRSEVEDKKGNVFERILGSVKKFRKRKKEKK